MVGSGGGCIADRVKHGADALPSVAAMAVPKQKQSHARTTQRRSQHKAATAGYNSCPTCHTPRLPHRVCPTCGHYRGREIVHVHEHDHDHD